MRLTAIEELVIKRKRKYKSYWRDAPDWYWLWKLLQQMLDLAGALLGIHSHSPSHELEHIASMSMNWMERRLQAR